MSRDRVIVAVLGLLVIAIVVYLYWPDGADRLPENNSTVTGRASEAAQVPGSPSARGDFGENPAWDANGANPTAGSAPQAAAARHQAFCVRGMVLTENGDRVAGARVESGDLGPDNSRGNAATAYSDAGGFYELQLDLDTGKPKLLSAQKPGFLTTEAILQMRSPGQIQQDFVLRSAQAALKGRVLGPNRRPVAGAQLTITGLSDGKSRWSDTPIGYSAFRGWSFTTTAGSSGEFLLPGLPVGSATVQARARGYYQNNLHRVSLGSGENAVDIRLDPATVVSFAVRNRRGQAVENVSARVYAPETDTSFQGNGDREGVVELNVPLGITRIDCELTAAGYQPKTLKMNPSAPPTEVLLDDGWTLRGRVVSSSGQPLSGARVSVVRFVPAGDHLESRGEGQVMTDANGTFEIGVSSDRYLRVQARRQGFLDARAWVDNLDNERDFEISMRPPDGALHGVVLDPSGRPARDFHIQLWQVPDVPAGGDPLDQARVDVLFTIAARFEQQSGRFEFPELPAGNLQLRVSGVQGDRSLSKTETVQIRRGVATEILIRLDGGTGGSGREE